jgi:hypothetical protein
MVSLSNPKLRTNGVEVVRGNRKNGKLPTENPDEPIYNLQSEIKEKR